MKHTCFYLTILLLICASIPLQSAAVDIDLDIEGSAFQDLTVDEIISDVTFTLIVTNRSEVSNLKIDLAFRTYFSEEYLLTPVPTNRPLDFIPRNPKYFLQPYLLPITVRLAPTTVHLAPSASEEVKLTIPENMIRKSGNYVVSVSATPDGGNSKWANLTVNVAHTSDIILEVLDDSTQTTTTTETEDISYILRISNTGPVADRIYFAVSSAWTATLDRTEVELFPDSDEDITLTIPRAVLYDIGTYNVRVVATSHNDPRVKDFVIVKTIVANRTVSTDLTGPMSRGASTESILAVVFSEIMFASEVRNGSLPQWIEVYNNTNTNINLRGWKLDWKRLQPSLLEVTTAFKEDFIIPPQHSRLLVTALGRHSMGGDLSDDAVYPLHVLHADELGQNDIANRNRLITRGGFSLKLINSEDVLVDHIGTLIDDRQTWQLPECLINGVRSSLIRRFDAGVPRSGLEHGGWSRAVDMKRLPYGLYYGHPYDRGTPGYRRGRPLPVALSQFSARFDKDEVVISWTTESELNNAGFNILRSTSRTENFRPINPKLIQGAGTTGERNTYQFIDKTAKPDVTYYYQIEDVSFSGAKQVVANARVRGVFSVKNRVTTQWGRLKAQ